MVEGTTLQPDPFGQRDQPVSDVQVWGWLADVPDPEIPVVSIVDLGIVRYVQCSDGHVEIALTPTYSGCPATGVIIMSVEQKLIEQDVQSFNVRQKISPPWTTDWISEEGKKKLQAYGIAPPDRNVGCAGMMKQGPVVCPRCRSADTSRVSQFGSTPCKALYRCNNCLEPFDYFKPF